MLVLTRRINESIVINNDVSVLVVEVRGDRVRLGIEAPKDVTVHRKEVYDVIREASTSEKPKKGSGIRRLNGL
jgi:carbon storage regulator